MSKETQPYVNRWSNEKQGYERVHLFELMLGDRFQILNLDGSIRLAKDHVTDQVVIKEWDAADPKVRALPYV